MCKLRRSYLGSILRQLSASIPDGPEPPFVNTAARKTKESFMSSYATRWTDRNGVCRRASGEHSSGSGCFCLSKSTILLDNGRILFYLLFVNSFKGLFAFPLLIRTLIFLDILKMFVAFLGGLKRSCIVWPSYISSSVQSDNRLFTAFRCSLDFEDSLGFWSNKAGITWTAFSAVDSYGVLFTHRLKRCVVSSIHFFPEAPFGSMNIFLFH